MAGRQPSKRNWKKYFSGAFLLAKTVKGNKIANIKFLKTRLFGVDFKLQVPPLMYINTHNIDNVSRVRSWVVILIKLHIILQKYYLMQKNTFSVIIQYHFKILVLQHWFKTPQRHRNSSPYFHPLGHYSEIALCLVCIQEQPWISNVPSLIIFDFIFLPHINEIICCPRWSWNISL